MGGRNLEIDLAYRVFEGEMDKIYKKQEGDHPPCFLGSYAPVINSCMAFVRKKEFAPYKAPSIIFFNDKTSQNDLKDVQDCNFSLLKLCSCMAHANKYVPSKIEKK